MYASLGPKELTLISDRLHRSVLAVHLHSISCFLTTGNVASCHHVSRKPGAVGPQMGCCVGCAVVAPKGIHVIGVRPDDCHVPTSYHVTDAGENNQMMTSCHGNASIDWPFVKGIHRSSMSSHHKTPVMQFMVSLLLAQISCWTNRSWFKTLKWRHCNERRWGNSHEVIQHKTHNSVQFGSWLDIVVGCIVFWYWKVMVSDD